MKWFCSKCESEKEIVIPQTFEVVHNDGECVIVHNVAFTQTTKDGELMLIDVHNHYIARFRNWKRAARFIK